MEDEDVVGTNAKYDDDGEQVQLAEIWNAQYVGVEKEGYWDAHDDLYDDHGAHEQTANMEANESIRYQEYGHDRMRILHNACFFELFE